MSNTKERNHNLDYIRILAMFLIVQHHVYLQMARHFSNWGVGRLPQFIMMILGSGGKVGVNLFMLITGYFLINRQFKVDRIINVVVRVWVIAATLTLLSILLTPINLFQALQLLITPLFPFDWSGWWYITGYVVVIFLSPILNNVLAGLNKKHATWLIMGILLLTSILPFFNIQTQTLPMYATQGGGWLIVMYLIGGYIRLYPDLFRRSNRKYFLLLMGTALLTFARFAVLIWVPQRISGILVALNWNQALPWTDHDPMMFVIAVSIFMIAVQGTNLPISKFGTLIANQTLALYMLHNSNPVSNQYRMWMQSIINGKTWRGRQMIIYEMAASLLIFGIVVVVAVILAPIERFAVKKALDVYHRSQLRASKADFK